MSGGNSTPRRLEFRFSRPDDDKPAVPASVLIQTLEGAQRLIWLIALSREQRDIKSRVRIPAEIEQRYQLRCEVPLSGSYVLPVFLQSVKPLPAALDQAVEVIDAFKSVAVALHNQNASRGASILPDSAIRRRVVVAFQLLAPKPGSGWLLDMAGNGTLVRLDDGWQRRIRHLYPPPPDAPTRETVNSELIEINFAAHLIAVRPLDSQRLIKVTCPEEMEDVLLEYRRQPIQITGRVFRGDNDEIGGISDPASHRAPPR